MLHADHAAMYMTEEEQLAATAECRSGPALIFLPPMRGTYWPLTSPALGEEEEWRGGVRGRRGGVS